MAKEIERKFLVDLHRFSPCGTPFSMKQGYLSADQKRVIRIRISNNEAFLTIKSSENGITRNEYEYAIPYHDAIELLDLCEYTPVEKTRWEIPFGGMIWEVDVFEKANQGLIVAEIELEAENQLFEKPDWIGEEVSTDERYFNFNLSKTPYSQW